MLPVGYRGGVIRGDACNKSASRNELGGQLYISSIVSNMIIPDDINPTIKTSCNCISTLNKVSIDAEYIRRTTKHVDLISVISEHLDKSAFNPVKVHV